MLEDGIAQILEKVYQKRGFDFRQYKETTLTRRIERRLKATKAASYQEYLAVLDADPTEYKKLLDDLTIKVTEFFRDPKAWEALGRRVMPEIIQYKMDEPPPSLKIWSAGCATGEEAYSIAILLDQFLSRSAVTIYATDIDNDALLKAQEGRYNPISAKGVSKYILDKYFDFDGNTFVIKDAIRTITQFKFHDLVLGEPLKGMDLIICRNVVIYFERPLQEKIFMDFYNGLNNRSYLVLALQRHLVK